MTKHSKGYAFKFAFLFSVASAVVFCAFIYFYISLAKDVEEIRTEGELYLQTKRIIDEMDGFDPKAVRNFIFRDTKHTKPVCLPKKGSFFQIWSFRRHKNTAITNF